MPKSLVSERLSAMAQDRYAVEHSDPEPELLAELTRRADEQLMYPRMNCGPIQGRLLRMLVRLMGATEVLEVGTFIGYSGHCLAEGIPEGGHLDTIEVNDEMEPMIISTLSDEALDCRITFRNADARELLPEIDPARYDLIYLDADKRSYPLYYRLLVPRMRSGALLIADNTLWGGKVTDPEATDPQTSALREFNDLVRNDPSVDKVLLPLRDGLTLILKR